MLSTELRAGLDNLWNEFWPATEVKPLAVIDFINSVFFLRYLQAADEQREQVNRFNNNIASTSIYGEDQQRFKWSVFQHFDKVQLYQLFNRPENNAMQFAGSAEEYKKWPRYLEDEAPLVAVPELLFATVRLIARFESADLVTRDEMTTYLLQKMEEDKQPSSKIPALDAAIPVKENRSLSKKWNVVVVLLAVFISGFTFAYFYSASKNKVAASSTINKPGADSAIVPLQADNTVKEVKSEEKSAPNKKKSKLTNTTSKSKSGKVKQKPIASQKSTPVGEVKGKYKIVSKAYFHNEPDESTRRNAFVVHWNNSYATLNALDEENGFVYVVFKNDQNQTSKGWLRKKDLKPVD